MYRNLGHLLLISAIALNLCACSNKSGSDGGTSSATSTSTAPQTPNNKNDLKNYEPKKDEPRFQNRGSRPYNVLSYNIAASYSWITEIFSAKNTITVRLLGDTRLIILDAKNLDIFSASDEQGNRLDFEYIRAKNELHINLPKLALKESRLAITISYAVKAAKEGALRSITHRIGDPVKSKVVYSHSEPLGAAEWMPCNNFPNDRAKITFSMLVRNGETFVTNGTNTGKDEIVTVGSETFKKVTYQTDYSIPTYLVAFAMGELEVRTKEYNNLPISYYARRGLTVDYNGLIEQTISRIQTLESKLGSFPFEKYATVLLPDFGGGEENAGMTFNDEIRSSNSNVDDDLYLISHELAHQWFGDLVTVDTWDDLWIKEGMATLLSAELMRNTEDRRTTGRLLGTEFSFNENEAIYDTNLSPDQKYTTGPYERAAWFLTQIRYLVGEDRFWSILKKVIKENAFASIGTEEFLSYFATELPSGLEGTLFNAITTKAVPEITVKKTPDGIYLNLEDKGKSMLAPMSVRMRIRGFYKTLQLSVDNPIYIPNTATEVNLDPFDIHPDWTYFMREETYKTDIHPLTVPKTSRDIMTLYTRPTNHQIRVFDSTDSWSFFASSINSNDVYLYNPEFFSESYYKIYKSLNSDRAKFNSLNTMCMLARDVVRQLELKSQDTKSFRTQWLATLQSIVNNDAATLGMSYGKTPKECLYWQPMTFLKTYTENVERLSFQPDALSEAQIKYLAAFDFETTNAILIFSRVYKYSPSVRSKHDAMVSLIRHSSYNLSAYETSAYSNFYKKILGESRVPVILVDAMKGLTILKDVRSIKAITKLADDETLPASIKEKAECFSKLIKAGSVNVESCN